MESLYKNPFVTGSWNAFKYIASSTGSYVGYRPYPNNSMSQCQMHNVLSNRNLLRLVGISGAVAVVLGAYGAHSVMNCQRNEHAKVVFDTASRYHFYHSLALIATPFCRLPKLTAATMVGGIVLFCGTCYYESITGDNRFKKLAPYGGSLLIISWITMIL